MAWFSGRVNVENVNYDEAIKDFQQVLDPKNRDAQRKFDFANDYVVINELGKTYFWCAQQDDRPEAERTRLLQKAVEQFERTLQLDAEDVDAHEFLNKCYSRLGGEKKLSIGKELSFAALEAEAFLVWPRLEVKRYARRLAHALGLGRLYRRTRTMRRQTPRSMAQG